MQEPPEKTGGGVILKHHAASSPSVWLSLSFCAHLGRFFFFFFFCHYMICSIIALSRLRKCTLISILDAFCTSLYYLPSLLRCTGMTLQIFGGWGEEKNLFFLSFLLKGTLLHAHLFQTVLGLEWIVRAVSFSLKSHVGFSFFFFLCLGF